MSTVFIRNLPHYLRMAARMNPPLLAAKMLARLGFNDMAAIRRMTLTADADAMDPQRLLRLWSMFDDTANRFLGEPVGLRDRRVLEVGCGPLAGFAPVAIHGGARSYEGFDPDWSDRVFRHPQIERRYLRPVFRALSPAASDGELANLHQRFDQDCVFSGDGIEKRNGEAVDLVISLSCLEHIADMDGALRTLVEASHASTRHVHLVNFSNHRSKLQPFDFIYTMAPEDYVNRYGQHINLLRPSQIAALFDRAGLQCTVHPVSVMPEALEHLKLHPAWTDRFAPEELAIRTALIAV